MVMICVFSKFGILYLQADINDVEKTIHTLVKVSTSKSAVQSCFHWSEFEHECRLYLKTLSFNPSQDFTADGQSSNIRYCKPVYCCGSVFCILDNFISNFSYHLSATFRLKGKCLIFITIAFCICQGVVL